MEFGLFKVGNKYVSSHDTSTATLPCLIFPAKCMASLGSQHPLVYILWALAACMQPIFNGKIGDIRLRYRVVCKVAEGS